MSEPESAAYPMVSNRLLDMISGAEPQRLQNNALLIQQHQQQIGAADIEMVARAASPLLNMKEEEAAAAYPGVIASLKAQGFGKYAPAAYPGHAVTQHLVSMGIPADKQFEYGAGRTAASGAASGLGLTGDGTTGTTGGATGGAAAPTAPAVPGTGATIGQRQNNPGNLTFAGQPNATPGRGNRFASFPDMPTGVAANADQLALYQTQHGINTVRGAVTRWVGDPKADLTTYIGDIAKSLGVSPDAPIDLTNPDVQAKFILAQFPHESAGGGYVLNPADVAKGVQMAAARRGQIVQPAPGTATAGTTAPPYRVAGPMQPPPGGAPVAPTAVPAGGPPTRTESVEPETGLPVVSGPAAAPAAAAPAPAPTPAVPAAQPPAAPAQPAAPQVPLAPTLPLLRSGLTADQEKQLRNDLDAPGIKVADVNRITAHYQALAAQNRTYNEQAAQHNYERTRAAAADVETRAQHAAAAEQRKIENERAAKAAAIADQVEARAQQKTADEQADRGRPYQGSAIEAQDDNILLGGDDGSAKYAGAYSRKAKPIDRPDGSSVTPNMTAYDKPTYKGGKGQVPEGGAPDYGPTKVTPPTTMNVEQSKAASYADRMLQSNQVMNELDKAAQSWAQRAKTKAGDFVGYNVSSPEYQRLRIAQENFITAKLRDESGASIGTPEFERDRVTFFPQPGDDAATVELKRKFRQTVIEGEQRRAGPAYKPPSAATSTTTQGSTTPPSRVIRYDHAGKRIEE